MLSASAAFFLAERVFATGFGDSDFVEVVGGADFCERFEDVSVVYGPALPLPFAFLALDFGMMGWEGRSSVSICNITGCV